MLSAWCEAGFRPDDFWVQTPATFTASMEGVHKRREAEIEMAISQAYHTAAFNAATKSRSGLKPLSQYLKRPSRKMSNAEMLANMRLIAARVNRKT